MPENEYPHANIEPYRHAPKDSPEHAAALVLITVNLVLDFLHLTALLPAAGRADILAQIEEMRRLAERIPTT